MIVISEHRMFGLCWHLRSGQRNRWQVQQQYQQWRPHLLGLEVFSRCWVCSPLSVDVLEILQENEIFWQSAFSSCLCCRALFRDKVESKVIILKWIYFYESNTVDRLWWSWREWLWRKYYSKMGRMLPDKNILSAKPWRGLGKPWWVGWRLESSCSSLNLWYLLGFAFHKDALELLV